MNPYSVIVKPLVSEKSTDQRENVGKYAFYVRRDATKHDVKAAVEKLYEVKVASVNTLVLRGKLKRRKMHVVKTPNRKKAYVTLEKGNKLPIFEEQ